MQHRWSFEHESGTAAAFHDWEPTSDGGRRARWFDVTTPALVLGSAQRADTVDEAACAAAGVEVVQRRSGGGAVLLVPGEVAWLDVVIPAGDPLWVDDVGRSMHWFGEVWTAALHHLGVEGAQVHRGSMQVTAWSRLVCFDGLGPGEVVVAGSKAVGISQRRTRQWARLQAAAYARWRPEALLGLLRPPMPEVGELRPVYEVADLARLVDAVTAALDTIG